MNCPDLGCGCSSVKRLFHSLKPKIGIRRREGDYVDDFEDSEPVDEISLSPSPPPDLVVASPRDATFFPAFSSKSISHPCMAIANEDVQENAVVISTLDRLPFCCHADLLLLSRKRLMETAMLLNSNLPAALQIDISPQRTDRSIRDSIERLVGIQVGEWSRAEDPSTPSTSPSPSSPVASISDENSDDDQEDIAHSSYLQPTYISPRRLAKVRRVTRRLSRVDEVDEPEGTISRRLSKCCQADVEGPSGTELFIGSASSTNSQRSALSQFSSMPSDAVTPSASRPGRRRVSRSGTTIGSKGLVGCNIHSSEDPRRALSSSLSTPALKGTVDFEDTFEFSNPTLKRWDRNEVERRRPVHRVSMSC